LLDLALWDATLRAVGLPIAQLLGGTCRAIPAYDSRGLGPKDSEALAIRQLSWQRPGAPQSSFGLAIPILPAICARSRRFRHGYRRRSG
jgi:mandelate racemase